MFKKVQRGPIQAFEASLLAECNWLTHAFLTRHRGVSDGPFATLNFSMREGDAQEHVDHNFGIISNEYAVPTFFSMHQVHGDRVLILNAQNVTAEALPQADAVLTAKPGIGIGVKTADCVPILLVDRVQRIIGAVHAGWRSTALAIAPKAVAALVAAFSSRTSDIVAAIGPCIGACCYEVDQVVFDALGQHDADCFTERGVGRWMLDLAAVNRAQLIAAGLNPDCIVSADVCTSCCPDLFFSHRGEGGYTGRQFNFIALRDR